MSMIAEKLIEIREKYGLSQDDFAELMGMNRTTYLSYESGKTLPDSDFLVCISRLFSISFDDLALSGRNKRILSLNSRPVIYNAGMRKNKNITDEEEFIITCYRQLDDTGKEKFLDDLQNKYVDLEFNMGGNVFYK